jgi:hypothetical protein
LESEGAECHFKNLSIKELPSTNPKPEECAKVDEGYVSLFDGLDLTGWRTGKDAWKVNDGVVKAAGKAELATEKKFGPCELLFDCRMPAKSKAEWSVRLGTNRTYSFANADVDGRGNWNRVVMTVGKDGVSQSVNGRPKGKSGEVPDTGPVAFAAAERLELRSIFLREIKEK